MRIKYPLLIDGGLSNVLEKMGNDLNHNLWSAKLLEIKPEAIIQAHLAYLNAGSQCIITASYQASIEGFIADGQDYSSAEKLILKSVQLAEIAIERFLKNNCFADRPLIGASIGPYGAYLADGSEYHGDYNICDVEMRAFHINRIQLLDQSNADFLACETIPSFQEAKVLGDLLKDTQKQAWISFACKDEKHISDGSSIADCITYFENHSNIFAIGINCTAPKYVSELIKTIKALTTKKIVIYPNSGAIYRPKTKTWVGVSDPIQFASISKEWLALGADIIGGCCKIGPKHIKSISELIIKN